MRFVMRGLLLATVTITAAVFAPAALASSTVSVTALRPSTSAAAATDDDLGLDLSFANSATDTPRTLQFTLPPGLLADAAQDNGVCLRTPASSASAPPSGCEVGSGTVTAEATVSLLGIINTPLPVPVSQSVDFYLVAPPDATDLAGLEVYSPQLNEQLGPTGDVFIRPSASADGVGATIALTLPDTLPVTVDGQSFPLAPIQIESIDSTLQNLRNPATCPAGGLPFGVTTTGYGSGDGASSTTAALDVTGCSSLSYAPRLSVAAVKDASDKETTLTTDVTAGADDAPSGRLALSFPTALFASNLRALPLLCTTPVADCTPVGSVTAVSPLYPTPLTGTAYLTGSSGGLTLTLVFPAPFPLTLVGSVSLLTDTAAFSGLPDIPLTQLSVKLDGGSRGLFATACRTSTGTATAAFTAVDADQSRSATAGFTVAGCPGAGNTGGSGAGAGGSGDAGSGGSSATSSATSSDWNGDTHLVADAISGLRHGRPSLRFTVAVRRRAAMFSRLEVRLPTGLTVRTRRRHGATTVPGVSVRGARIRSLRMSHHQLVITLRHASRRVVVSLGTRTLRESRGLRAQALRRALRHLTLRVAVRDARRRTRVLTVTVHRFVG